MKCISDELFEEAKSNYRACEIASDIFDKKYPPEMFKGGVQIHVVPEWKPKEGE